MPQLNTAEKRIRLVAYDVPKDTPGYDLPVPTGASWPDALTLLWTSWYPIQNCLIAAWFHPQFPEREFGWHHDVIAFTDIHK